MSNSDTLQENLSQIDRLSSKGRGLSSDGKWEVFGALPGEEVLVQFCGKKRKLKQGYTTEVIRSSSERVPLRCKHAHECGGCSLQQLDYRAQLRRKEEFVEEIFSMLIEEHSPEIRPILGCKDPWEYRNKMEFSFSQNRKGEKFLGLMLALGRGKVLNLTECHLVSPWFSKVLGAVYSWWDNSRLSAYHHRSDQGQLRTLTVREAKQGKGKMVMLTVSGNPSFALKKSELTSFIEAIRGVSPEETLSIFLQVQQIAKGRPTQFFEMLLHGQDHITEVLDILGHRMEFKISPTSFFQPNTKQAEKIFSEGIKMLSSLRSARVFDLYCGGATIGLSIAKLAKEVVGIELNPHSVFDAGWNQEVNGVENFSIFRGDVKTVLEEMRQKAEFTPPDVVVVDPPRSGLDEQTIQHLEYLSAKEILYISCNPSSQAKNIEELAKRGYRLKILQPVDQFPHTVHLENIALLEKT